MIGDNELSNFEEFVELFGDVPEMTPLSRPRIENFLGDPSRPLLSC